MVRPVGEPIVVLASASSGIGRETAVAFGARGAADVLAARNEAARQGVAWEIDRVGGRLCSPRRTTSTAAPTRCRAG